MSIWLELEPRGCAVLPSPLITLRMSMIMLSYIIMFDQPLYMLITHALFSVREMRDMRILCALAGRATGCAGGQIASLSGGGRGVLKRKNVMLPGGSRRHLCDLLPRQVATLRAGRPPRAPHRASGAPSRSDPELEQGSVSGLLSGFSVGLKWVS